VRRHLGGGIGARYACAAPLRRAAASFGIDRPREDTVPDQDNSLDTLVSASGTLAGIGLALVGIMSAKSALNKTETIADDFFLFSSIGFLVVLSMGYLAQKEREQPRARRIQKLAEWIFSLSLVLLLVAGFVLVYTEI